MIAQVLSPARTRHLAVSLLALSLSGCMVGPDYSAPPETLARYHNAVPPAAGTPKPDAVALDQWWSGFHDPALNRIIDRALAQNLDLAAALARVDAARAAAREAGAKLLPSIDANSSATALHQSLESPVGEIGHHLPGFRRNVKLYEAGLGAAWEIDLAGGLKRGAEAAQDEAEAAEAQHLGTRISVAAEAADAYLQIRGVQARLSVAQNQVDNDDSLLKLVRQQRADGIAADREAAEAEALLRQARASIPPLRIQLETQLNRLDVLMGAQPGTYAAELATPEPLPAAPVLASSLTPADLLRRRPDILAAERHLAAATAGIGVATAEYYPKISLSALLGVESLSPGHLVTAATFQPQATAALQWRLFDFGKLDAELAQAQGTQSEALAQYRQSILRATEEVEDAFVTQTQLADQSQELSQEITALTQARDRSQEAYRAGTVALTDVLDTDRQLLAARDEWVRAETDTGRAAVSSYRALGGGW